MELKDTSAAGRHSADLALMRLGHEMRRRTRDREVFANVLREVGARMSADAVLLWMPYAQLRVTVATQGDTVAAPMLAEFESIPERIAPLDHRSGQPIVIQGDDARAERAAACRLLIAPIDTGTARSPAWLVFARALTAPRFDTWSAVLAQVQGLRLARRLMLEADPATGHLNHRGLRIAITQRSMGCGSLILADLDGLRPLNHTRGVAVGDAVIAAFARLLEAPLLPPGTLVARIDGAKFALLVPRLDAQAGAQLATQLQNALEQVAIKDEADFPRLTVSCGVAEFDDLAQSLEKTLLAADLALRLAKERGRSRVEIHESLDASIIRRTDEDFAATDLREAIRAHKLELYAQPIVTLRDQQQQPPGFELLLRMREDAGASVDAARMLLVAQRYQMLPTLDRYVVDKAFSILSPHRLVLARQRVTMSINVSGLSFCDPEFTSHFIQELRRSRLPPGCIIVEVTEQVAVSNLAKAADSMRLLRAAGCGIAIDDFGTGANSLAYVHQLPVTRLKIDGSFVRDITTNKRSEAAVRGIVRLARDFVLQTVGEFVENPQQAECLRRLGVDFGQGCLFGKPEPLDSAIARLLQRESADVQEILKLG
jgi:diguanylate cyclase (GGDEF)-like protein